MILYWLEVCVTIRQILHIGYCAQDTCNILLYCNMEINNYQLINNKLEFEMFLNGIFALQILQMTTFGLATVPSSLPGKPNCPHTTLFGVLIRKNTGLPFSLLCYHVLGPPQSGKSHSKIPLLIHAIHAIQVYCAAVYCYVSIHSTVNWLHHGNYIIIFTA